MTALDDPGNVGNDARKSHGADEAALLRELTEALTALGNYLAAAQRAFENHREVEAKALQASLSQYERAAECLRRLRGHRER